MPVVKYDVLAANLFQLLQQQRRENVVSFSDADVKKIASKHGGDSD